MPNPQPLTAEESNLILAAMLQARLDGEDELLEHLAALAADPAAVRQLLATVRQQFAPQQAPASLPPGAQKPQPPQIPPSTR